jgi:nucleoside-diphosphate-sugar epimerase
LTKGIILTLENPKALNNDFNLSTSRSTTVLELSEIIWKKINGDKKFNYVSDKAMEYDVQKRIPDTSKAKELLGFEATTTLEVMLDEIIDWIKNVDL